MVRLSDFADPEFIRNWFRAQEQAAIDDAFRFFGIDPNQPDAAERLLASLALHCKEKGVFRRRGHPRKWTADRVADLCDDAPAIISQLRKELKRKPRLPEITKRLQKNFPHKYFDKERPHGGALTIRMWLSRLQVQKQKPDEIESILNSASAELRKNGRRYARRKS